MANFPLKKAWTKKPECNVGINHSNPLTIGLERLYISLPTGMFDLVTQKFITNPSSSIDSVATRDGIMRDFDGTNMDYDVIPVKDRRFCTLGSVGVIDALVSARAHVSIGSSTSNTPLIYTTADSTAASSALTTLYRRDGGDNLYPVTSAANAGDTFTHSVVGKDIVALSKLNNEAPDSHSGTINSALNTDRVGFGGLQRGSSGSQGDYKLSLVWLYDRALSDAELSALHKNPYQLFKPQTQYIDLTAASGAYTLTADTTAYTETGTDATLRAVRTLTADTNSYSTAGQDINLSVGHKLVCESNSYSLSTQDAALKTDRRLPADTRTYSLTGQDVTLRADWRISADNGEYLFTGQDATIIAPIPPPPPSTSRWVNRNAGRLPDRLDLVNHPFITRRY